MSEYNKSARSVVLILRDTNLVIVQIRRRSCASCSAPNNRPEEEREASTVYAAACYTRIPTAISSTWEDETN